MFRVRVVSSGTYEDGAGLSGTAAGKGILICALTSYVPLRSSKAKKIRGNNTLLRWNKRWSAISRVKLLERAA